MSLRPDFLPALSAFESAARHQNFAHAAEELHLTASAVSHHVRKLEARLGVTLFQRHARGVSLTAEGRRLADSASIAMSDLESVLSGLQPQPRGRERLRINTLHSLAYSWLLPRLPRFTAAHPELSLTVETEAGLARFEEGGPDLALRYGVGPWPGLSEHPLMGDAMFPVASPAFAARHKPKTAADITQLTLISDLARQGWHDWFRAAGVHGRKLDERHVFSDTTDALQAAVHGLGAAMAREKIVAPYLADRRLVVLPGPVMPTRWSYSVVYPSHRQLKPAARAFLDWVLAEGRS
jgi:DNA-binding transcriptional LysR family regulator